MAKDYWMRRYRCPKCSNGSKKSKQADLFRVYVSKKTVQLVCRHCGNVEDIRCNGMVIK